MAAADGRAVGRRSRRGGSWPSGRLDRRRRGGDRVVHVLSRARGEPVGGGGDHRHERGDRRAAGAGERARADARAAPPGGVPARRRAATWASGCRVRASSRCRASITCRGRVTSRACSIRSSCSSAGSTSAGRAGLVLTTVLEADLPPSEAHLLDSVLSRFRGQELVPGGRGRVVRASFDGPARALAARSPSPTTSPRSAPASTPASASCTTARSPARRWRSPPTSPARRSPVRSSPPRRCRTSSRAPGSTSTSAGRSATAAVQRAALTSSSTTRASARPCRSGARRRARRRRPARPAARASSHWPARAHRASSQRPSGDHSRRREPARGGEQRPLPEQRISVRVAASRTASASPCRRAYAAASTRSCAASGVRVALAGHGVADRAVRGGRRSAAGGRRRDQAEIGGRAPPREVRSTLAVSASSTVTVPSPAAHATVRGAPGRQAGRDGAPCRAPASTSCSPLPHTIRSEPPAR